jgi:hypothetical protein
VADGQFGRVDPGVDVAPALLGERPFECAPVRAMFSGPPQPNVFSPWTGLAVLCAYAAAFLVAGAVVLVKRDA